MKSINKQQYEHKLLTSSKTAEKYSFSADLTKLICSSDFFIHHEILPPGLRTSAPHFHKETDEVVYLLKGSVIAIEDKEEINLFPGDCICFSANSRLLHYIVNRSDSDAEMLVIKKKLEKSDVIY